MEKLNKEIYNIALENHFIDETRTFEKLSEDCGPNKRLDEYLDKNSIITSDQKAIILARISGYKYVNLDLFPYDENVIKEVSGSYIVKHHAMPVKMENDVYTCCVSDPLDLDAINSLKGLFGNSAEIVVCGKTKLLKLQSIIFSKKSIDEATEEYEIDNKVVLKKENNIDGADVLNAPAVKMVESIMKGAIAYGASDIHIEPYENIIRVRYRVDGMLYENNEFQVNMYPAVATRIKIMSGLNIAEKRVPQDGRIKQKFDGIEYDFRVSTLPTAYGEKIVIRILDSTTFNLSRENLGFLEEENKIIDRLITKPNGIILLTGPTGCGKSTTLYSFIKELNTGEVNIVTVEDPIEYTMEGVNQVQINTRANLTFASALRSILRQDPNIVMIGEIRDEETAEIAIRMSITGHLVLSTLHTNDAAGAVTRLIDLGIQPFFVTDSLSAVIAQRLVRRLCPECKEKRLVSKREQSILGVDENTYIYHAKGCPACHNTGYKGRIGIHEILEVDEDLKELILKHVSTNAVREAAIKKGMLTLKDTCKYYVLNGDTSIEELVTVVYEYDRD